jgi:molybdenum cofactor guanylyltransferase
VEYKRITSIKGARLPRESTPPPETAGRKGSERIERSLSNGWHAIAKASKYNPSSGEAQLTEGVYKTKGDVRGEEQIAGVLLAGGLSRRMGGGDKGLRDLDGKPLIRRVLDRLSAQASPLAINANGDPSRFASFGLPVIADATADYAGPLAGVLAGLRWAEKAAPRARFIVTAACDTPFFPEDLAAKLLAAARDVYPSVALPMSGGQIHPVFGLWPIALADDLTEALARGRRKVLDWTALHPRFIVEFAYVDFGGTLADPFFNANTPQELSEAAKLLERQQKG